MSEVAVGTLADFLLARIAEDEADAKEGWERWFPSDLRDVEAHANAARCNRILGDALARRQVVAIHRHDDLYGPHAVHHCPTRPATSLADSMTFRDTDPCDTLRALALPYAAHPEFREEWRA